MEVDATQSSQGEGHALHTACADLSEGMDAIKQKHLTVIWLHEAAALQRSVHHTTILRGFEPCLRPCLWFMMTRMFGN